MPQSEITLSIVIATLGGDSLRPTIERILLGSFKPSEVLVCIPEREANRVLNLKIPGVRVVITDVRGQVAQRVMGFKEARGTMVLQIDDDIKLELECLQKLVGCLQSIGPSNVVGPVYLDSITGNWVHRLPVGFRGLLQSLYASAVAGAPWGCLRTGRVTAIGVNYGVDGSLCNGKKLIDTDWLPGGCVLSFKSDLVQEDFFPFAGKAYCEDIIHSLLRRDRGIRHWAVPAARCFIDVSADSVPDAAWQGAMTARYYYTRLSGGCRLRARLYGGLLWLHWVLLRKKI